MVGTSPPKNKAKSAFPKLTYALFLFLVREQYILLSALKAALLAAVISSMSTASETTRVPVLSSNMTERAT